MSEEYFAGLLLGFLAGIVYMYLAYKLDEDKGKGDSTE